MDIGASETMELGISVASDQVEMCPKSKICRTHKNALHWRSVSGDSSIPGTSEPGEKALCSTSR